MDNILVVVTDNPKTMITSRLNIIPGPSEAIVIIVLPLTDKLVPLDKAEPTPDAKGKIVVDRDLVNKAATLEPEGEPGILKVEHATKNSIGVIEHAVHTCIARELGESDRLLFAHPIIKVVVVIAFHSRDPEDNIIGDKVVVRGTLLVLGLLNKPTVGLDADV